MRRCVSHPILAVVRRTFFSRANILFSDTRGSRSLGQQCPAVYQVCLFDTFANRFTRNSKLLQIAVGSLDDHLNFRDLGPQIAWKTVFLLEYAGPLFIYPLFYCRPSILYGSGRELIPIYGFTYCCPCYFEMALPFYFIVYRFSDYNWRALRKHEWYGPFREGSRPSLSISHW